MIGFGKTNYRLGGVVWTLHDMPFQDGHQIVAVTRDYFSILFLPIWPLKLAAVALGRGSTQQRCELSAPSMRAFCFTQWSWAKNSKKVQFVAWFYLARGSDALARTMAIAGIALGGSVGRYFGFQWAGNPGVTCLVPGMIVGAAVVNGIFIMVIKSLTSLW